MDAPWRAEFEQMVAAYPLNYIREFGTKLNGESLPSLSAHNADKLAAIPRTARPHVSWKQWNVDRQREWLDTMPPPTVFAEYDSTYWHEPHGDIAPTLYRSRAEQWAEMLASHPNGSRVTNGPIVTRWWLINKNGNPLDWWHDGANRYGVDVYEPENETRVFSSEELFGPPLDKIYRAVPDDVDILIPEYGRHNGAGKQRAEMLASDIAYLRSQHPRVKAIAYFNSSKFPELQFAPDSPEGLVWETLCAA